MFALYKLQAKVWFVNIFNKIDFFIVVLFLAVMGSIIASRIPTEGYPNGIDYIDVLSISNFSIISSISLMMVASSAINTFGMSFFEMKKSVLLKRIGATEITKPKAIGAFILWGMTSMIFIVGWMFLLVALCQIGDENTLGGMLYVAPKYWANVQWAGVFAAIFVVMISFYAISFFFISISKDVTSYQMLATFYFFLATMLGGSYTPNADRMWMDVIGFMTPLGWGGDIMNAAMNGHDWWNIVDGFTFKSPLGDEEVTGIKAAANIFVPILYGGLAGIASAKFFKWD